MANTLGVTPADLILRYDANLLGMIVNDNSVKLTAAQLQNDPATQTALDDAAGFVLAALYVAYKYTSADIANLLAQNNPPNDSVSLLKRLVCDLALVWACQRRAYDYGDKYPMLGLSLEMIQQLRYGERVLNLPGPEGAGLTSSTHVGYVQQRCAGLVISERNIFPSRFRTPY